MRQGKWIGFFLLIATSLGYCSSLREEIQESRMIRSALTVATRLSYEDSATVHTDVRPLAREPQRGTVLGEEDLKRYFHDDGGAVLPGYKNSFEAGDVYGCIYSIDARQFDNKFFIAFPGTQTMTEWAKNFFGITHFRNNIQKSYHDDVENIYAHRGSRSFLAALCRHINAKRSAYREKDNGETHEKLEAYEYYFTGHSRGGGLAYIAAVRFKEGKKEGYAQFAPGHVKVVTFCTPRLMNAHKTQSEFVRLLGYENMVHFVRPSDIAPKFPFRFVENQGIQILLQPNAFWSLKKSHRIPVEAEVERSVEEHNRARGIGWLYPLRSLFTLEPKPLLWGVGGICLSIIVIKTGVGSFLIQGLREIYFGALLRLT